MSFSVNTENFEGPLDLMLHLIKTNKLDLFDLDMNILTAQYINYINALKHENVEIASEYLSELASLIEYKSKKLLPKEKVLIEENYEVDERERLVARLLEYKNYKEAAEKLELAYQQRQELHSKSMSEETQIWIQEGMEVVQGSPYELMKAMQRILKRQILNRPSLGTMRLPEISFEERYDQVINYLKTQEKRITFLQLCEDCVNLEMVVMSFLVVLDLMKTQHIYVSIEDEMIVIQRKNYE